MPLGRYKFATLFDYNFYSQVITPKYTVIINNTRIEKGELITPRTYTGGVNLYITVGKDFAGSWDASTRTVTISGVYE